jgi:hypothetical protein
MNQAATWIVGANGAGICQFEQSRELAWEKESVCLDSARHDRLRST